MKINQVIMQINQAIMQIKKNHGSDNLQKVKIDE
jgi:hypothetical protein